MLVSWFVLSFIMSLLCSVMCQGLCELKPELNLPRCYDIDVYWMSLQHAIMNLNDTVHEFNLYVGLLFVKVNLELSIKLNIPPPMQVQIRKVLGKLATLMKDNSSPAFKELYLPHGCALLRSLPPLNMCHMATLYDSTHAIPTIDEQFTIIDSYFTQVSNIPHGYPSPSETDACLRGIITSSRTSTCDSIVSSCLKMIKHGNNFGFALTARLIQAMFIRYTTRCYIISETKDQELIHQMCAGIFNEATKLVAHDYMFTSLLAQQIGMCVQNSYIQFLNKLWLERLMRLQDPHVGCFVIQRKPDRGDDHVICDNHLTGSMVAALSYTVRYLTKKCYI